MENFLCAVGSGDQERAHKLLKIFRYVFKLTTDKELDVICYAISELVTEQADYAYALVAILAGNLQDAVLNGFVFSSELLLNIMNYLVKINVNKKFDILPAIVALNKIGWRFFCKLFCPMDKDVQVNTLYFVHNTVSPENSTICYRKKDVKVVVKLPVNANAETGFFAVESGNGGVTIKVLSDNGQPIPVQDAQPLELIKRFFLIFLAYKLQYDCNIFDKMIEKLTPVRADEVFDLVNLHIKHVFSSLSRKEDNWLVKVKDKVLAYIFKEKINSKQFIDVKLYALRRMIDALYVNASNAGNEIKNISITMAYLFSGKIDNIQMPLEMAVKKIIESDFSVFSKVVLFLGQSYIGAVTDNQSGATMKLLDTIELCFNDNAIKKLKIATSDMKVIFTLVLEQIADKVKLSDKKFRGSMTNLLNKLAAFNLEGSVTEIYDTVDRACAVYLKFIATNHSKSAKEIFGFLQTIGEKLGGGSADYVCEKVIKAIAERIQELKEGSEEEMAELTEKLDTFIQRLIKKDLLKEFSEGLEKSYPSIIADSMKRIQASANAYDVRVTSYKH
jgi:hypothetical protein